MANGTRVLLLGASAGWLLVALSGCGTAATSDCVTTQFLTPANVVLDHNAVSPANQTSFGVGTKVLQGSCAVPASIALAQTLSVSDPLNVQVGHIGSAATVMCVGATAGPVVVISGNLTAALTCQ